MIDAYEDPGTPDTRGGWYYLWWLVRVQPGRSLAGALLGSGWLTLMAGTPYLMARAVDDGLVPGRMTVLAGWTAAIFLLGAVNAWVSIMRHRTMTRVRMDAYFRTVKVVVGHAVRLGAELPRRAGAGEVVTIGVGDVHTIAQALTVVGPGVGAVVVYAVVAGLLTTVSPLLTAVVLLGVPVVALFAGPLTRRLQGRETEYRERQGILTARIGDLAAGLRVLNGLGGKSLFADAFRRDSRHLRAQGYRVGAVASWVQALGMGLPTVYLAVVTWIAARMTAQGEITVGQLVSVYGYVAVLVGPVAFFLDMGYQLSRGVVAARRVVRLLRLEPQQPPATERAPAEPAVLHDPESGVRVRPGLLTALVGASATETTTVIDRLGRYTPSNVTWGPVRLDAVPLPEVRSRILVAENEAHLFADTLRAVISAGAGAPHRGAGNCATSHEPPAPAHARPTPPPDAHLTAALHAAAAEDIVQALPHGLDSPLTAQARNLSGGQRQRVRLARALLTDPEILLAVEPTSALDAHTESLVAERLRTARAGRTTLLTTTSPLMLAQADEVIHLVDGKVAATGTHEDLLGHDPGYRALVARDTEDAEDTGITEGPENTAGAENEAPTRAPEEEVAR
ncbi:ABC transporter transmembrane domain-containing protein [Streptomyces arenae]|uniref:ABC transporter transmembrane domain-containing protein n=1 Tax=Streptomyces arenae TaxID=29301 RepID=UPI00265853FB|nr:ABC transporter ATP-binding protein [Streptomyces arenae]MCG7205000.1 ABC transporter ATP-binding protein/permease [Streptomyces arenae]